MRIDDILEKQIDLTPAGNVHSAMKYSLMAGGKRIRPELMYLIGEGYGLDRQACDNFAMALEMIHTYSLIHDDLPAMDDDDLRRGLPTCHKQFGEATAILAGDGLLTYAFETASHSDAKAEQVVKCIRILAECAGPAGMVYGQDLDMSEEAGMTWDQLKKVHYHKTGCLLSASCQIAAVLASRSDEEVRRWHEIGIMLGLAFQVQDDVLDVELTAEEFGKSNSDAKNEKVTSVTLLGKEEAVTLMNDLYNRVENDVDLFSDFNGSALKEFIDTLKTRRK